MAMYRRFFKRWLDVSLALVALPFWILILLIVGPMIYCEDRGSIFYNAPRLGKDGKVFKMYKFRSMKMAAPDLRNADGSTFNAADDPRLTKVGKFLRQTSLDETPQILNVLKGEMSLIGPRPDLPEHRTVYQGNEGSRLEVRPGISGYNQAYYRNAVPWKERMQHDVYYIEHLSFGLDLRILGKTIAMVLRRSNIYTTARGRDSGAAARRKL